MSIAAGITGQKEQVHIGFGRPLAGDFKDDKEVATAIDSEICRNFKLWPRNYIAYDEVYKTRKHSKLHTEKERENFLSSYKNLKPEVRDIVLKIYSNPVSSFESYQESFE